MISKAQVNEALKLLADYAQQLEDARAKTKRAHEIGCRVRLSEYGIKMQGARKKKLRGTVIKYLPSVLNPTTDGVVYVKWDSVPSPDAMHISQIEPIKN
jgi:hypothetical protein